jgi:PAS domain S-box-containing protein
VKRDLLIPDTNNLPVDLEKYRSMLHNFGIRSLMILPIMGNEGVMGCLGLDNIENPGRWTLEEFNLLIILSKLFSSSFHRKSVEQDLIESEEIHRILLDATKEGIMIINPQGRITEVSNIILEIFKASSKEEFTGRMFVEFIPIELRKQKKVYFSGKVRKGITNTIEVTFIRNDNTTFVGEVNISLLRKGMKETTGYLVVIRDISERKRMDKQLLHTERMAGIGVMAAGMAHEINQPLNTISLTMDNLMLHLNNDSPDKAYIDNKTSKIFDNITRIRNIIDHVRAFSKDHDEYVQLRFNINESIRNAKSMISEQLKHKGIRFVMNLDGNIPRPVGNTYKFEQVIVNLIINAKDAIEEKQNVLNQDFNKILEINSFREDQSVCVEVKDNGIGIEPGDIDKVMLPFYTTKNEGIGTGLGLSISFSIISDMNGTIEVQSERLKGTTMRIRIPIKRDKKKQPENVQE